VGEIIADSRATSPGIRTLILGVDRFMSEARALTNLIGNGLATVVVAKWEGALDEARMHAHLDRETSEEADTPEKLLPTPEPLVP
jgi:aerobic C4-dicarboxylate transport protein